MNENWQQANPFASYWKMFSNNNQFTNWFNNSCQQNNHEQIEKVTKRNLEAVNNLSQNAVDNAQTIFKRHSDVVQNCSKDFMEFCKNSASQDLQQNQQNTVEYLKNNFERFSSFAKEMFNLSNKMTEEAWKMVSSNVSKNMEEFSSCNNSSKKKAASA